MKTKKITAVILILLMLVSGSCFAADDSRIFRDFKLYTGTVWLLNEENSSVILQNVKTKNMFNTDVIVPELEYKETPIIAQNIFSSDGKPLSFETVNAYLLDRNVRFIAAKNSDGWKVLYMEIY